MPLKGPLPITDRRRREHFEQTALLPSRHHKHKLIPRKQILEAAAQNRAGINQKLLERTEKIIKKASLLSKKGLSPRAVVVRQALLLDSLAAENADHAIQRFKSMGLLPLMASVEKIEVGKINPAQVERQLWEKLFGKFIVYFRRENQASPEIIRTLIKMRKYLTVPQNIHFERSRRWTRIHSIAQKIIKSKANPEKNLLDEIESILTTKFKSSGQAKQPRVVHHKALDIIVAASIYADVLLEEKTTPITLSSEKELFWDYAYSEAMEKIYPKIEADEELVEAIIAFNKPRHPAKPL
ncbi:MAG: hypothetical protein WCW13_07105 [archaeon]|jgi:hypothetical protein